MNNKRNLIRSKTSLFLSLPNMLFAVQKFNHHRLILCQPLPLREPCMHGLKSQSSLYTRQRPTSLKKTAGIFHPSSKPKGPQSPKLEAPNPSTLTQRLLPGGRSTVPQGSSLPAPCSDTEAPCNCRGSRCLLTYEEGDGLGQLRIWLGTAFGHTFETQPCTASTRNAEGHQYQMQASTAKRESLGSRV